MKAADVAYVKPRSLQAALEALAEHGESAQVLAGGQSLLPMLALRVAAPACLVDIGALDELRGIARDGDTVRVGAMVTHGELEASREIADAVPLLAQAVPHVAHPAIRNAGTIGGSIALADPAAEYPAVALALQASIVLRDARGTRRVPADAFFQGFYQTARAPGELVVAIEFPAHREGERSHFGEFARRRGDYAMAGLAAWLQGHGERIARARLAYFAVGERPVLAHAAMAALADRPLDASSIADAQAALARDLAPADDLQADAATKRHLARVLLGRALAAMGTCA